MSDTRAEPYDVLDHPVAASLSGAHRALAVRSGHAMAYQPGVATFTALEPGAPASAWDDLASLLGPGGLADLFSADAEPPDWPSVFGIHGVQMVRVRVPSPAGVAPVGDARVLDLGAADVPDMIALVEATRPGPFLPRTIELGRYVGVRLDGRLVAMAGERLRPPGWTEVSAVATAPDARGRGFAGLLVQVLVDGIERRGEGAFLHVAGDNPAAVAVYRRLGFRVRRTVRFHGYRVP